MHIILTLAALIALACWVTKSPKSFFLAFGMIVIVSVTLFFSLDIPKRITDINNESSDYKITKFRTDTKANIKIDYQKCLNHVYHDNRDKDEINYSCDHAKEEARLSYNMGNNGKMEWETPVADRITVKPVKSTDWRTELAAEELTFVPDGATPEELINGYKKCISKNLKKDCKIWLDILNEE